MPNSLHDEHTVDKHPNTKSEEYHGEHYYTYKDQHHINDCKNLGMFDKGKIKETNSPKVENVRE